MNLRVVTFNVRYGNAADGPNHWDLRKGILLEAVAALDPHVMGVQECMPFQGDEIKMRFPHLDRLGVGRYHGVVCEARPQESRSGEHCDIFFDTHRFLAEHCGTFWHSETPDAPGSISWGNPYPRITTWAILRSRTATTRFAFFCTHYEGNEPCCTKATDLMIERIGRIAAGLPCVVVGDFNLKPDSASHARLTGPEPGGTRPAGRLAAPGKARAGRRNRTRQVHRQARQEDRLDPGARAHGRFRGAVVLPARRPLPVGPLPAGREVRSDRSAVGLIPS